MDLTLSGKTYEEINKLEKSEVLDILHEENNFLRKSVVELKNELFKKSKLEYIDVDFEHEYRKTIESLKSEVKELKMLLESQKLSGEIVNNSVLAITQHIRTEDKKEIDSLKSENEAFKKQIDRYVAEIEVLKDQRNYYREETEKSMCRNKILRRSKRAC